MSICSGGTGDGRFARAIDCALKVSNPVIADFDGDGVVDLAEGNVVLLGMHECNFTRQVTYSTWPYCLPLAAGDFNDFNGDGRLDLIDLNNSGLRVLINTCQ